MSEVHGPCGGGDVGEHGGPDDRHCRVCIDKSCRYNQPDVTVWLVISSGVYDQGVWLVASSREEAEAFCANHSPDTDGYHDWRIESHVVGQAEPAHPRHPKTKVEV